jgi:transposase
MEKRQRITNHTLVIGMDIGSEFNAACFMDKEGTILGRYPTIYNSRKGFDYFQTMLTKTRRKHKFTDVLIGMEPTGHYWRKIAFFAKEKGYEVRFVRTTAVKHQRELDESSSARSDIRDAYTIGNIVREGKYIDTVIEDSVFRQLRTLAHARERILRYIVGSTHGLQAHLNDYFPELRQLFWSMKAKGLWRLLETYPFPEDVRDAGLAAVVTLLSKGTGKKRRIREQAAQVYQAAVESVGLKAITKADRVRLTMYLEEIKRSDARRRLLEGEMKELLTEIPCAQYILSSRTGKVGCAVFRGAGEPRVLQEPAADHQVRRLRSENDSGLRWAGRSSEEGTLAYECLFFMVLRLVHRSSFFKAYYEHKKKGFDRPLAKIEALCAVILKLIRVLFALMRDKRRFTEERPRCEEAA